MLPGTTRESIRINTGSEEHFGRAAVRMGQRTLVEVSSGRGGCASEVSYLTADSECDRWWHPSRISQRSATLPRTNSALDLGASLILNGAVASMADVVGYPVVRGGFEADAITAVFHQRLTASYEQRSRPRHHDNPKDDQTNR